MVLGNRVQEMIETNPHAENAKSLRAHLSLCDTSGSDCANVWPPCKALKAAGRLPGNLGAAEPHTQLPIQASCGGRPTWTDPDKDKESQAAASDDASDEDDGIDRNPCSFPDLLFAIAFSHDGRAMIYAAFYYQYAGRVDFDDSAAEDAAAQPLLDATESHAALLVAIALPS